MIAQGDIWWTEFGEPMGSEAGYLRPMLVVQSDALNTSRLGTVLGVPMTSNMRWVNATGNVLLRTGETGLRHDSLALVSLLAATNRSQMVERAGGITRRQLDRVFAGIDTVLGR